MTLHISANARGGRVGYQIRFSAGFGGSHENRKHRTCDLEAWRVLPHLEILAEHREEAAEVRVAPVTARPFTLLNDRLDGAYRVIGVRDGPKLLPAEQLAPGLRSARAEEEVLLTHLLRQVAEARFDRSVEVADGPELLQVRRDFLGSHDRDRVFDRGQPLGIVQIHALGPLEEQEVAKCLLTERKQLEADSARIVPGWLGQVGPRQMRAYPDGRQQVAGDGQMKHLLLGNHEDRGSPPLDRCELLVREPFIDGAFEREGRKEVLTHESVLKLRGRAEHVDERAAMLDNDGALVHLLLASQVEDVAQPTLDRLDARRRGPA